MDKKADEFDVEESEVVDIEAEEKKVRDAIDAGLVEAGAKKMDQNGRGNESRRRKPKISQRWWDEECAAVREEKRRALNAFVRRPNDETWTRYKCMVNKMKATIRKKKRESGEKFAENISHGTDSVTLGEKIRSLQKGMNATQGGASAEERGTMEEEEIKKIFDADSPNDPPVLRVQLLCLE